MRRDWRGKSVKKEVLSATMKARGRLLHYLDVRSGACSLSRAIVSAEERATRQAAQEKRRNVAHRSAVAKSNEAPSLVREDPDTAEAWAHEWSTTNTETAALRRRRLDGELARIGEEWSLSNTFIVVGRGNAAAKAPRPGSAFAAAALRTA